MLGKLSHLDQHLPSSEAVYCSGVIVLFEVVAATKFVVTDLVSSYQNVH